MTDNLPRLTREQAARAVAWFVELTHALVAARTKAVLSPRSRTFTSPINPEPKPPAPTVSCTAACRLGVTPKVTPCHPMRPHGQRGAEVVAEEGLEPPTRGL